LEKRGPPEAAGIDAETYVNPVIGHLPVAGVDTGLVLKILRPIWNAKPETANRVRGRVETILDWAKTHSYRQGDNPARWKGHLDNVLPKRSKVKRVRHHPALPYPDVPEFVAELRDVDGITARALEFTILTAARTGAIVGATLSEIDLDAKIWTVPPERAGTKIDGDDPKPRRVPLSDRAIQILKALPREDGNPHVFIGQKRLKKRSKNRSNALSNMAMLELMREMRPRLRPTRLPEQLQGLVCRNDALSKRGFGSCALARCSRQGRGGLSTWRFV
jgi:integrase